MKVLVTGYAGFLGSHLTESLLNDGHQVLGIDRFSDYYDPEIKIANVKNFTKNPAFTAINEDLCELPLSNLLKNCEVIYHLAGQPGVTTSWGENFKSYVHDNILATQVLFDAANSEQRIVIASSSSVYGEQQSKKTQEDALLAPRSPYGVTKEAVEQLASTYSREFGLQIAWLRYFTIYGPRQRPDMAFAKIVHALNENLPFALRGDGSQSRDFTFVTDAVSATEAIASNPSAIGPFNVGGEHPVSMRQVIDIFESVSGRKLIIEEIPNVAGDLRATASDNSKIKEITGWQPVITLEEGIRAQLNAKPSN